MKISTPVPPSTYHTYLPLHSNFLMLEHHVMTLTWRNVVREAHTELMSPSVCPSVFPSIRPSVWNTKARRFFNVGVKIRVSRWNHLSVLRPLEIPIPTSHHVSNVDTLSTEVKPKTISCYNQKSDTMAQPEKKFLQPTCSKC